MKNLFSKLVPFAFVLTSIISFELNADSTDSSENNNNTVEKMALGDKNIVEVAEENSDFSILVKALKAADLVSVLQEKGPFTVFAPTDKEFAKLATGTLDNLLKPENKAKLVALLTYHVIPGRVLASDIKTMKVKTVNGKELDIKVNGTNVTVNDAKVVKTDILGTNGVIHVIDKVLMP